MVCTMRRGTFVGQGAGPIALVVLLFAFVLAALTATARADPARYEIDPEHTTIAFLVSHIGYQKVLGQFTEFSGGYLFDEKTLALDDLELVIRAGSVDTHHEERDEHLRSADFLAVEDHPQIRFSMTDAKPSDERTGEVTGILTILGVSKPVTLRVTWNKSGPYPFGENYVTGISARTRFKRSDFGMTYGVANGLVGDEIEVIIESEAIRQ